MLPDTTDQRRHTVHSTEQYTINALFPAGDPGGLQIFHQGGTSESGM